MARPEAKQAKRQRCAIYTRKSSEEGLEQSFNSLHAQREACEAYIRSQRHEGWVLLPGHYDDGGVSGGTLERPALQRLLEELKAGQLDCIVVYKVDRLSRSLADFARLVELFDQYGVSFVSVTQQFNTSTSMGRLTLNVLLSFAQFEREVTGERIRDKIAASKRKGMWMGGVVPLGYDVKDRQLVVNEAEAEQVRHLYQRYRALKCVRSLKAELDAAGQVSKRRPGKGKMAGGRPFCRGGLYRILRNPLYVGRVPHHDQAFPGQHVGIIEPELWEAVQQQLASNRVDRQNRTYAQEPSLLAGLLYDDRGNPMSPSHGRKGSRRYRYYVSQAVLQYREDEAGSVQRVPAATVEDVVVGHVRDLLSDAHRLLVFLQPLRLTGDAQQAVTARAAVFAEAWPNQAASEQLAHLRQLLTRVVVGHTEVAITLSRAGLLRFLLPNDDEQQPAGPDDEQTFTLPVELKRRGYETRLVLPSGDPSPPPLQSVIRLRDALKQALTWHAALVRGKVRSVASLAAREKLDEAHVRRRLQLAYLAPDLMQAIIDGTLPPECSPTQLRQGIPMDWSEQRRMLGSPVRSG